MGLLGLTWPEFGTVFKDKSDHMKEPKFADNWRTSVDVCGEAYSQMLPTAQSVDSGAVRCTIKGRFM